LSAIFPMHRTALVAVALAFLALAGARGSQTTHAAKTHPRSRAIGAWRARTRLAAGHTVHPGAKARVRTQTRGKTKAGAVRRQSPDEAGFAAGLAIRRLLLSRQANREAAQTERVRVDGREGQRAEIEKEDPRPKTAPGGSVDEDVTSSSAPTAAEDRMNESRSTSGPPDSGAETTAADGEPLEGGPGQDGRNDAKRTEISNGENEEASLSIPRRGAPLPLRGSVASLERQNARLDAEGLERIEDEADLESRIANKLLVPLPASSGLTVNADLPETHRYCRPWTARFLTDLARAHEAAFHRPIEVNSAVRTVEYQKQLMMTNGNAAPAEGELVSPHLTGATVDIAKEGMTRSELAWMRKRLAGLQAAGEIDVEEEFQQACFHVTVYKSYAARQVMPAKPAAQDAEGETQGL